MKKKHLLLIAVIFILGTITYFAEREKEYRYSVLSGTFENLPTEVASRTSGRVLAIFVSEGDLVKKGDRLLELDPGPLRTSVEALKSKVTEAELNLKNLQAGYRAEEIAKQQALVEELRSNVAMMEKGYRSQDIAKAEAQLQMAEASYAKQLKGPRSEEIAQGQAQLDAAEATLVFEQGEIARYKNLFAEGVVSRQDLDIHEERYKQAVAARKQAAENLQQLQSGYRAEDKEMARAQAENARQQLSQMKEGYRTEERAQAQAKLAQAQAQLDMMEQGYRPQEIALAKAALRTAQLNLQAEEERLAEYMVTAPIDGVVEGKMVATGDLINSGVTVIRMCDPQDIWLKVYLSEDKLALVKVGDAGEAVIDGIEGLSKVHVEQIATKGEYTPVNLQTPEERGRQVFAVKLRLNEPNPQVKAGMNATVKTLGQWQDKL